MNLNMFTQYIYIYIVYTYIKIYIIFGINNRLVICITLSRHFNIFIKKKINLKLINENN